MPTEPLDLKERIDRLKKLFTLLEVSAEYPSHHEVYFKEMSRIVREIDEQLLEVN